MQTITIFTDGSSRGNPGPGGWGAVLIYGSLGEQDSSSKKQTRVLELGGRDSLTTNNRMELTAVTESLREIKKREYQGEISIYSDSTYVLRGISSWVYAWEKNNWMTTSREPVSNKDLWVVLLELTRGMKTTHPPIIWKKIEGHQGIRGNEQADTLATAFADRSAVPLFSGSLDAYEKLIGGVLFSIDQTQKTKKAKGTSGVAYSYVSLVSGQIFVDTTWDRCKERVSGKKGVRYRKALSKEDEQDIIASFGG